MNINIKSKFIFIHIPKNAGTSLSKVLGFGSTNHSTASEVRLRLGRIGYRRMFSFAFVRHPYDRFLSLYNYARMEESYYHSSINPENAINGKHLDFDKLKNASLYECALMLKNNELEHDLTWNHWQPQSNWIYNMKGRLLVDFVGKVENIDEDFDFILRKVKKKSKVLLPNINTSNKNKLELDLPTKLILKEYYRVDFRNFKYKI